MNDAKVNKSTSRNQRKQSKSTPLTLEQVAVVITRKSIWSPPRRKIQCNICLEENVPQGILSKKSQEKYRIRKWMVICEKCVCEIMINEFRNTDKLKGFDGSIPFKSGESINANNIFF